MARPPGREKEIRLRVSAEEKRRIEAIAAARGWSVAQVVREATRLFATDQQDR